ncbi:hypothetical protein ABB37_04470 [Leptomonas pyrrhocoris]|uniref:Uncharacterized protein n=1 Tax=Leptomonas pyrrhocoris TaxID=157538 RepID=A0A0M9G2K0_LEPPY|nr:hypothetical protein ABB37_04470 [Leptomonas pyrrhocoris]KPA81120.1 hypothetical protein ABB37_04470 [Leptomonas pyrrhocoris]|eukprot:XP_015659559.1 hypothetical protein ABB37_04470 [Leptomonas pyrrhocoris]
MLVRGPFTLEKAETVCQWYYRIGFFGLPWLWGLLYIFFRHYQHESDAIRWYVERAKLYSLSGAAVFLAVTLGLLLLLPASSALWVIAPFQDTFQWGIFAANMSANASSDVDSSSSASSSGMAVSLFA